jgi:hypothetical protein
MHARALFAAPLAALLAADVAATAGRMADAGKPVWSEVTWPFLRDQWGAGRAFHCDARHCGTDVDLYLRAKVGFCNCAAGVADDDEIDRVGDLDLIAGRAQALAPGHPVAAGFLHGRARAFRVDRRDAPARGVLALALSNRCDAIAATVVTTADAPPAAALDFLAGETVQRWAEASTGSASP